MSESEKVKEPYDKPTVSKVVIVSGELAATGCKVMFGGGPVHFCALNPVGSCKQPGS